MRVESARLTLWTGSTGVPAKDMEAATKADVENVVSLIHRLVERMDQRFESLVEQMDRRFEGVERRFDAIDNRLDRVTDTLAGVQSQMAAMTKWADRFDRDLSATLATQVAQQRAIDSLAE